jgi:hypothetical protein
MHLTHEIQAQHAWPAIDSVRFDPPPRSFDAISMSELHIGSPQAAIDAVGDKLVEPPWN